VPVKNVLIIGGGVYGCFVAEYTAKMGCNTTLIEKEPDLIQRASRTN
jgi:heterodisulfide reductase subunit A-like polyferredoxin